MEHLITPDAAKKRTEELKEEKRKRGRPLGSTKEKEQIKKIQNLMQDDNKNQAKKEKEEEDMKKSELMRKIGQYYIAFPSLKPKPKIPQNASYKTWLNEYERIKAISSQDFSYELSKNSLDWLLSVVNVIIGPALIYNYGINLGAAQAELASSNYEFVEPELKQLVIEYPYVFNRGPIIRLLFKISTLAHQSKFIVKAGKAVDIDNERYGDL